MIELAPLHCLTACVFSWLDAGAVPEEERPHDVPEEGRSSSKMVVEGDDEEEAEENQQLEDAPALEEFPAEGAPVDEQLHGEHPSWHTVSLATTYGRPVHLNGRHVEAQNM